jgi:hypothetical protein
MAGAQCRDEANGMAGAQCRDEANGKAGASGTSGALIGPESWLEKGRGESEDERQRHDRG